MNVSVQFMQLQVEITGSDQAFSKRLTSPQAPTPQAFLQPRQGWRLAAVTCTVSWASCGRDQAFPKHAAETATNFSAREESILLAELNTVAMFARYAQKACHLRLSVVEPCVLSVLTSFPCSQLVEENSSAAVAVRKSSRCLHK